MISDVIPAEIVKSKNIDGGRFTGRPPPLTTFQTQAKKAWIILAKRQRSGNAYQTDVKTWTCRCGGQQLQAHHLCKHLVQAVEAINPSRPTDFFETLTCRRTMPIYRIPHPSDSIMGDSTISDGDDEIWMGPCSNLGQGNWRLLPQPSTNRKRSRSPSLGSEMSSSKRVGDNLTSKSRLCTNHSFYSEKVIHQYSPMKKLLIRLDTSQISTQYVRHPRHLPTKALLIRFLSFLFIKNLSCPRPRPLTIRKS